MPATPPQWLDDYRRLHESAVWWPIDERTQIAVRGRDRSTFLHNFCTADVRNLQPGQGREAFVTNVRGKVLGHVVVFAQDDLHMLDGDPGQQDVLIPHLERYILREDVQLEDVSGEVFQVWLAGPELQGRVELDEGNWPAEPWSHTLAQIGGCRVALRRLDMLRVPAVALVAGSRDDRQMLESRLRQSLGSEAAAEVLEAARIENRFPRYGVDITAENLPQEVDRDRQAISFTKGCYLGQETVARIDALGHVNRTLVGVRFDGPAVPEPGTELMLDGKPVGRVTSSCYSPALEAPLALAYIRRECNAVGTRLESVAGLGQIVDLPPGD